MEGRCHESLPTPYLLNVTAPLLELVRDKWDTCVFVRTHDLVKARGNGSHVSKLDCMHEELFLERPRDVGELPTLVLNCEHGHMILMEGNNRHTYFLNGGQTWFPVRVMVEVGSLRRHPRGKYPGMFCPQESLQDTTTWFCTPMWMRKDKWRNDIRGVFKHVFNMETLDLDAYYDERTFKTSE